MLDFRIHTHSLKGSLANIGAMDLSRKVYNLEAAADTGDQNYCIAHLPEFLEELLELNQGLIEAFAQASSDDEGAEVPFELVDIFKNLKRAFVEIDLKNIERECEKLDALTLGGAMQEEVEQIKDAVMMMDYDSAVEYMQKLAVA